MKNKKRAFTLLEVIIYIALFSMLMLGILESLFYINIANSKLDSDIENSYKNNSGFAALVAVILISFGALFYCMSTAFASYSYADFVNRREMRVQASLNVQSCIDYVESVLSIDPFIYGNIDIDELGCKVEIKHNIGSGFVYDVSFFVDIGGV